MAPKTPRRPVVAIKVETPRNRSAKRRASAPGKRRQKATAPHPSRDRPPRPRSAPVTQGADRMVMEQEIERFNANAKYLYGFTDPAVAGRGPTRDTQPTTVCHFRLSQTLTFTAYQADWAPEFDQTGSITAINNLCMLNPDNDIAVVVCPQPNAIATTKSGMPAYSVVSGATFDPTNMNLNVVGLGLGNNGYAKPSLLQSFPEQMPLDLPAAYTGSVYQPTKWRCVGLRTTCTVTTPAMTAQGSVFAGDNRDYYLPDPAASITTEGQVHFDGAATDSANVQLPLNTYARSVRKVGAFANSAVYEACWLPGHDRATDYVEMDPIFSWLDDAGAAYPAARNPSLGNNFLNSPCNVFKFEGVLPGMTVQLDTIFAVEFPVTSSNTLSLFMQSARLASHFVPEWNQLSCMNAGGHEAEAATCFTECAQGARGMALAVQGVVAPGTRPNKATGQGPASSTHHILSHLGNVGVAAAGLFAQPAVRSRLSGLVSKLPGGLTRAVGRFGQLAAAFGRNVLPEALMLA